MAADYKIRKKQWNIVGLPSVDEEMIRSMAQELKILPQTARLLAVRGMTDANSARAFISHDETVLYNPFLFQDMEKAVVRILSAVEHGERLAIFGDYDVDGVTSVSALMIYLRSLGADVRYYIPCRVSEGYGISCAALDMLAEQGVSLLITVDTGITAVEEVEHARSLGMEVIITDHHECHAVIPDAFAVINPRCPDCAYPFKELAGVGVVFKLLCGLEKMRDEENYLERICRDYIDLAAVGTIADVMSLTDENRLIVSLGLHMMQMNPRMGLRALLEAAGVSLDDPVKNRRKINSSLIGFTVAPRINAAGRIADASLAVDLFLTDDGAKSQKIARELCEINRQRQNEENKISEQAYAKIEAGHDFTRDPVIVLAEEGWHNGVIGIVSSRITEHYHMPSILISMDGDHGKGSGRSVKGLNLVDALSACGEYLIKFGGHELATGLSIEKDKLNDFREALNAYARAHLQTEDRVVSLAIDARLTAEDLTLRQATELALLEPCGMGNPVPLFCLERALVCDVSAIGNNRHTRLTLKADGQMISAVYFGAVAAELDIYPGDLVNVAFNLEINEYQGNETLQLLVRDLVRYGEDDDADERVEAFLAGDEGDLPSGWIPDKGDFSAVYVYLRQLSRKGEKTVGLHGLQRYAANGLCRAKVLLILAVFRERGLLTWEMTGNIGRFSLIAVDGKVDLEQSVIMQRLKRKKEEMDEE